MQIETLLFIQQNPLTIINQTNSIQVFTDLHMNGMQGFIYNKKTKLYTPSPFIVIDYNKGHSFNTPLQDQLTQDQQEELVEYIKEKMKCTKENPWFLQL